MDHNRYIDIENVQARKRAVKNVTPPKVPQRLRKTVRRKRPYSWEPIHIYVYRNGDDVSPALRLTVRRSDVDNWEQLLLSVGDRLDLTGYVKRLYNLNGDWVRGSTGIRNGQYYVAVGGYEAFRNVMYGQLLDKLPRDFLNGPPRATGGSKSPPKNGPKKNGKAKATASIKAVPKIKVPPSKKADKSNKNVAGNKNENKPESEKNGQQRRHNDDNDNRGPRSWEKSDRNVPTAKNGKTSNSPTRGSPPRTVKAKLPSTKKSIDSDEKESRLRKRGTPKVKSPPDSEDSAYISESERRHKNREARPYRRSFEVINGVPPSRSAYYAAEKDRPRQKKVTLVDYDEDNGGVYKAKRPNSHTKYAREVREMRNLPIDLPIDEVEATEVGEEIYEEDSHKELKHRLEDPEDYEMDHLRPNRQLQSPTRTA